MLQLPLMTDEDLQRSMELEGPKYKLLVVDASLGWLLVFKRVYGDTFDLRSTETCSEAVAIAKDAATNAIDLVLWDPYPLNLNPEESLAGRLIRPMREAGYEGSFALHLDSSRGDIRKLGDKIRTSLGEYGNEIRFVLPKPASILHIQEVIRRNQLPL